MLLWGRYLHFQLGNTSPERATKQRIYYEVSYPDRGQEDYGRDEKRVVDGFDQVLFNAVKKRLRADVPVVSYLSGGVDSSLVVAMANKALGRPIPTFTISVKGKGLDEKDLAVQLAKHLGCEMNVVDCGDDQLRTGYPELIRAAEFPVMDTSCLGLLHLARAVHAQGYKVALTGEGADEWLGGYSWFKMHKATGFLDIIPAVGNTLRGLVARAVSKHAFPMADVRQVQHAVGGQNGWLLLYGLFSLNKLRFFSPAMREAVAKRNAFEELELTPNLRRWHPFHRQMYLGSRIMLPGHLLASKGDRIAMHSSVETRYAFLDEDVTAYMAKLHPRWKLRGLLRDKFVERKVAERWLPKEVAWRRKHMFRAPMDSWANRDGDASGLGGHWIDQVLSRESILKAGYFDADAVTAVRHKLAKMRGGLGRTGLEMGLTAVTATQMWHHLYLGGGLCELPAVGGGQ